VGVGSEPDPAAVAGVGRGHAGEEGASTLSGGHVFNHRARGNRVAATSARPVVDDRPGQREAAAVAAVVGQLRRRLEERAGAVQALQRQGESRAKGVSRSAGLAVWRENPGCRDVSVCHLLDVVIVDVYQDNFVPAGFGFRPGRRERNPRRHSLGWERSGINRTAPSVRWQERSTPASGRAPSNREGSAPDR